MSITHGPLRTCIGCRKVAPTRDLVRLVVDHVDELPAVNIDRDASAPGRGAWVHEHPDCLAHAIGRQSITRALRVAEPCDMTKITRWLEHIRR